MVSYAVLVKKQLGKAEAAMKLVSIYTGVLTAAVLLCVAPAARAASVSGKVVTASKVGISGVTVTIWLKSTKRYIPTTSKVTNSSGQFSFTSVAAGTYKLSARVATSTTNYYADRWFDTTSAAQGYAGAEADDLVLLATTNLTNRDITLVNGGRIATGILTTGGNTNGIQVRAHALANHRIHHNTTSRRFYFGTSGADGRVSLRNLPAPNNYYLFFYDVNAKWETLAHPTTKVTPAAVKAAGTVTLSWPKMALMVADPYEKNNSYADSKSLISNSVFKQSPPGKFITSGALIGPRNADIDWYCWDVDEADRHLLSAEIPFDLYKVGGKPIEDPWVDPILAFYSVNGTVVTRLKTDDDGGPGLHDARIDTGVLTKGRYCAVVSMYGDTTWSGKNQQVAGRYQLTIAMGNRRPLLGGQYVTTSVPSKTNLPVPPASLTIQEGEQLTVYMTHTDPDSDTLTATAAHTDASSTPVTGGTFTQLSNVSSTYVWTPASGAASKGPYKVVFFVKDGEFLVTRTLQIIVKTMACTKNSDCNSKYCVDGFCCNSACGGNLTSDCQACSLARGAKANGICTTLPATATCRPVAGACDVKENCDGKSSDCPADTFKSSSTVCRVATGGCDLAESCTGGVATCPTDKRKAAGTVCRTSAGGCDLAESCDGSATACPTDGFKASGTVCRATAGGCDVAESCSGKAAACPADSFASSGTVCRATAGDCDVAESCSGKIAACPADSYKASSVVCRAASGDCDVAENCSGKAAACPTDVYKASGTVCRATAGGCDVAESCNGTSGACPSDSFAASGTVCRAAAGDCDIKESCDGTTAACPADALAASGAVCRPVAGDCDVKESCDGTTAACPTDVFSAAGTLCRAATGGCDVAESCSGMSAACPADVLEASGTVCRAAAGDCDVKEICSGNDATCPADILVSAGTACRPAAGDCDVTESCSGTSATCPADAVEAVGTLCRVASGDCDVKESCDGSSSACPADAMAASGTVCRAAAGVCDLSESCDGSTAACPADKLEATGTVCRATAGLCDVAESCDGTSAACPADGYKSSGAVCKSAAGICEKDTSCSGTAASCPAPNYLPAGTTCRAAVGECDVEEACQGTAASCPSNLFKIDGVSCGWGKGQCKSGICQPTSDGGAPLYDAWPYDGAPPDSGPDAAPDGAADGTPETALDGTPETAPDASQDEAGLDLTPDGKVATDQGGSSEDPSEEGCACQLSGHHDAPWLLPGLLLLGLLRRRRRRFSVPGTWPARGTTGRTAASFPPQ